MPVRSGFYHGDRHAAEVFIPVALPGIIAATIFAFTVAWAQFLYPLAFLYSEDQLVLTVGTVTTMDYHIAGLTSGATKS